MVKFLYNNNSKKVLVNLRYKKATHFERFTTILFSYVFPGYYITRIGSDHSIQFSRLLVKICLRKIRLLKKRDCLNGQSQLYFYNLDLLINHNLVFFKLISVLFKRNQYISIFFPDFTFPRSCKNQAFSICIRNENFGFFQIFTENNGSH